MRCDRCQGLMIEERFLDNDDCSGLAWMKGWRCMNCGLVLDRKIYERRLQQLAAKGGPVKAKADKKLSSTGGDRLVIAWTKP